MSDKNRHFPGFASVEEEDDFFDDSLTKEHHIDVLFPEFSERPAYLKQVEGPGAPRTILLTDEEKIIGRGDATDIHVPSVEISRMHASVAAVEGRHLIKDMESRNGLILNGIRIISATLHDGDIIQIGNAVFIFRASTGQRL